MIVGVAGGEYGIRGFIDAYDAQTGKRAWRFYTIPGPGRAGQRHVGRRFVEDRRRRRLGHRRLRSGAEPASSTAPAIRAPTITARAARATTCTAARCVALDADTGKLRWHYQFTPHDVHDWDATEVPILADITIAGQPRKVVMFANRNGFYYTLDRTTGKVDRRPSRSSRRPGRRRSARDGRPMLLPGHTPDEKGEVTCPDITGGTNFWPPTFDPAHAHCSSSTPAKCA